MIENNQIDILQELHQNAIDFAYEANSQRAFADARDGLKPGQRACLWEFYSKGYSSAKPHVKSAKVSGGVIASWWPHGDVAIYETFARMSQPWINNIPEVDWHGANGNQIIGNVVASARYTEARLAPAAEEGLLQGIKKQNVPMVSNFSEDDEWPEVLPAIMPRLMINGCQGIGYTLANTWVPYNLIELTQTIKDYVSSGELKTDNLYPDFPTGGIIINKNDLPEICRTGKGRVVVRARTEIKNNIISITELPYQVFVEPLIDSIKDLIEKKEIQGIQDIYNKSDKKRLLIEIECETAPLNVLQQLFKLTELQKTYNPNQYALVGKTPKMLNLKSYLDIYINHNLECIVKEHQYDLAKAQARIEIVNGLLKALEDIDNIIALIKQSESSNAAKINLMNKYQFSEVQAKAIVDMRLGKLANLEKIELNNEKMDLDNKIAEYTLIIADVAKQKELYLKRLDEFTKKYGKARRSEVIQIDPPKKEDKEIINVEPEKCVVVMTESGLIKRIPTASFRTQHRKGKGIKTQDDIVSAVIRTNTIDSLMIFSNEGTMYRLLVNDIPAGTNASVGVSIKSLVEMGANEKPAIIYSIYRDTDAKYVLFVTKRGLVKKTALEEYIKTKKKTGISAITLKEGDELAAVTLIKDEELLLISKEGMAIRFASTEITPTGRTTSGVKGMGLHENDEVAIAMAIRDTKDNVAIFTKNGLGKRTSLSEFPIQKRGGKGVQCIKLNVTCGNLTAAALISDEDTLLVCGQPSSICIPAGEITTGTRTAIGTQILKGSKILSVSKV